MSDLILYRGDSVYIEEFLYSRTDRYCLVGKGIYLTSNPEVADTYRTKGLDFHLRGKYRSKSHDLFSDSSPNLTLGKALEAAFVAYLKHVWKKKTGVDILETDKRWPLHRINHLQEWERLLKDKEKLSISDTQSNGFRYNSSSRSIVIRLIEKPEKKVGYLSKFAFPNDRGQFENAMFPIYDRLTEPLLWEMFYDAGLFHEKRFKTRAQYVAGRMNTVIGEAYVIPAYTMARGGFRSAAAQIAYARDLVAKSYRVNSNQFPKVQKVLRSIGYLGFSYPGGMMSGMTRHKAYSVWDEDFVNKHKVETVR